MRHRLKPTLFGGALAATTSDPWHALGQAALLLLVGGLSMLSLILVLVFVQNLLPQPKEEPAPPRPDRELRPLTGGILPSSIRPGPRRRGPRRAAAPRLRVDEALDQAVRLGLGEPRLLRRFGGVAEVRLYACAECGGHPSQKGADSCRRTEDRLEQAFRAAYGTPVAAREVECCRRGDAHCQFEVRH